MQEELEIIRNSAETILDEIAILDEVLKELNRNEKNSDNGNSSSG